MKRTTEQLAKIAEQYGGQISGLAAELKGKLAKAPTPESLEAAGMRTLAEEVVRDLPPSSDEELAVERIIAWFPRVRGR